MSVAAAENLHVYTCDATSAFLQAPLKEKIYLKAPPGFASFTDSGEEENFEYLRLFMVLNNLLRYSMMR